MILYIKYLQSIKRFTNPKTYLINHDYHYHKNCFALLPPLAPPSEFSRSSTF